MAEKPKNFIKTGYQNLLDFDPDNGIVKYGDYEVFASELGINPTTFTATFDDYRKDQLASTPFGGFATQALSPLSAAQEKAMRADFEQAVQSGYTPGRKPAEGFEGLNSLIPNNNLRSVQRLGPDSYSVTEYSKAALSKTDLLDQIANRANGLQYSSNEDILKQNQQDAAGRRRGAASTVLAGGAASAINS